MPLSENSQYHNDLVQFLETARFENGSQIITEENNVFNIIDNTDIICVVLENGDGIDINISSDENFSYTYFAGNESQEDATKLEGYEALQAIQSLTTDDEERRTILRSFEMFKRIPLPQNQYIILYGNYLTPERIQLHKDNLILASQEAVKYQQNLDEQKKPIITELGDLYDQERRGVEYEGMSERITELEDVRNNIRNSQIFFGNIKDEIDKSLTSFYPNFRIQESEQDLSSGEESPILRHQIIPHRNEQDLSSDGESSGEESPVLRRRLHHRRVPSLDILADQLIPLEEQAYIKVMQSKLERIKELREVALGETAPEEQMHLGDLIDMEENGLRLISLMHQKNPNYFNLNYLIWHATECLDQRERDHIQGLMQERDELAQTLDHDNINDFVEAIYELYNDRTFINFLNLAQEQLFEDFELDQKIENMKVAFLEHQGLIRRTVRPQSPDTRSFSNKHDEEVEQEVASLNDINLDDGNFYNQEEEQEEQEMQHKNLPTSATNQAAIRPAPATAAAAASASASASASAEKPAKRSFLDRLFGRKKPDDEEKEKNNKKGKKVAPAQEPAPAPATAAPDDRRNIPVRTAWGVESDEFAARTPAPRPAADGRPSPIVRDARLVLGGRDTPSDGRNTPNNNQAYR